MPGQEYNGFDPANPEDQDDLYRDFSSLKNATQKKISVNHGYPNVAEMSEGEISLRYVPGQGMFMFVRFRNKLYNTRMAEEGRTGIAKITDSTSGTVSETLSITKLTDSTGGSASDTLADAGVGLTVAKVENWVASLAAKINGIINEVSSLSSKTNEVIGKL